MQSTFGAAHSHLFIGSHCGSWATNTRIPGEIFLEVGSPCKRRMNESGRFKATFHNLRNPAPPPPILCVKQCAPLLGGLMWRLFAQESEAFGGSVDPEI